MARSYEQECPIARKLEIVGERWPLLILRHILAFDKTKFQGFRRAWHPRAYAF